MTMSNYLCHIVGEQPERVARMHASTVKRTKAFAIAIHIAGINNVTARAAEQCVCPAATNQAVVIVSTAQ